MLLIDPWVIPLPKSENTTPWIFFFIIDAFLPFLPPSLLYLNLPVIRCNFSTNLQLCHLNQTLKNTRTGSSGICFSLTMNTFEGRCSSVYLQALRMPEGVASRKWSFPSLSLQSAYWRNTIRKGRLQHPFTTGVLMSQGACLTHPCDAIKGRPGAMREKLISQHPSWVAALNLRFISSQLQNVSSLTREIPEPTSQEPDRSLMSFKSASKPEVA